MYDIPSVPKFCREGLFTVESVHKKNEFMKAINASCKGRSFTCSFNDKDKRKAGNVPEKQVVTSLGLQLSCDSKIPPKPIWAFGPNLMFNKEGEVDCGNYIWINQMSSYLSASLPAMRIHHPLGLGGLVELIKVMPTLFNPLPS